LAENALTAWVARTGCSICLQDLGDPALLRDKLREYDPELIWANKISDSDNHGDLLIVAVWYKQEVIAVLRYTDCLDGHFTEREQRWLEYIARRYIGPKLECVRRHTAERLRDTHSEEIATISVRDAVTSNETARELAEQFGATARAMVPLAPGRKTILFNVVDDDGEHFSHHAVVNDLRADLEERYKLDGSLTGFALSQPNVVFLADLTGAAEEGTYRRVFREAVCALACRIGPPERHPSGVLVVLSDRFDISAKIHGPALKLLSGRAGEILWRRDVESRLFGGGRRTAALKAGLRHLDVVLSRPDRLPYSSTDESHLIVSMLCQMVDAVEHDQSIAEKCEEFRVWDAIQMAASWARSGIADTRLDCRIGRDVRALAPRGFFIAILFDMLRYAWQFSSDVAVEANPRRSEHGAWFDVCVEGIGRRRTRERAVHGSDAVLASLGLSPGMSELPQSYRLARSYRLRDGRSGDLQIDQRDDEACYRCTFQLPIASRAPQPSTS